MANLIVEQKTVKELFQGSKYGFLIPDYQRPYEWEEEECKTLWDDLFAFCFPNNSLQRNKGEEYFLGPIVTFKNNNQMEVIDGQQRLTTLMLLLRAFYNLFGEMQEPNILETKKDIEKCLWYCDELGHTIFDSLKIDSQVATDDDKDDFLKILKDGKASGKKNRYAVNFNFFVERIEEFLHKFPAFFVYFPARIMNYCVLLPIEAESQDTALRIFSTLNDRGKPLADADIFKAQFYKYFSAQGQKEAFMDKWKELDKITADVFHPIYGTPLDELFTQYMYYARAKKGDKNTTLEGLRKFYEGDGTYPLLRNEQTLEHLHTLAKFWQDVANQSDERFSERVLRKLYVLNYAPNSMWRNITSVFFMHNRNSEDKLDDDKFYTFLDRLTAFIWGYAITNPGLSALRTPIFAEMVNIINGNDVTFGEYRISETTYRTNVSTYEFKNIRAITKAMLAWWAFYNDKQPLLKLEAPFDIEHIYPKNRQHNEHGLSKANSIELLGNKSLLEKRINIRASDYHFSDKKKYYNGYTTDKNKKIEGTEIADLLALCAAKDDFNEEDIFERNAAIIDAFVAYMRQNDILRA